MEIVFVPFVILLGMWLYDRHRFARRGSARRTKSGKRWREKVEEILTTAPPSDGRLDPRNVRRNSETADRPYGFFRPKP